MLIVNDDDDDDVGDVTVVRLCSLSVVAERPEKADDGDLVIGAVP